MAAMRQISAVNRRFAAYCPHSRYNIRQKSKGNLSIIKNRCTFAVSKDKYMSKANSDNMASNDLKSGIHSASPSSESQHSIYRLGAVYPEP